MHCPYHIQPHVLSLCVVIFKMVQIALGNTNIIYGILDGRKHLIAFHVFLSMLTVKTTHQHLVHGVKDWIVLVCLAFVIHCLYKLFVDRSRFIDNSFMYCDEVVAGLSLKNVHHMIDLNTPHPHLRLSSDFNQSCFTVSAHNESRFFIQGEIVANFKQISVWKAIENPCWSFHSDLNMLKLALVSVYQRYLS